MRITAPGRRSTLVRVNISDALSPRQSWVSRLQETARSQSFATRGLRSEKPHGRPPASGAREHGILQATACSAQPRRGESVCRLLRHATPAVIGTDHRRTRDKNPRQGRRRRTRPGVSGAAPPILRPDRVGPSSKVSKIRLGSSLTAPPTLLTPLAHNSRSTSAARGCVSDSMSYAVRDRSRIADVLNLCLESPSHSLTSSMLRFSYRRWRGLRPSAGRRASFVLGRMFSPLEPSRSFFCLALSSRSSSPRPLSEVSEPSLPPGSVSPSCLPVLLGPFSSSSDPHPFVGVAAPRARTPGGAWTCGRSTSGLPPVGFLISLYLP